MSLGIRQVRFNIYRAKTSENPIVAKAEPAPGPADVQTPSAEPEPKDADASDWDVEEESAPEQATTSVLEKEIPSKAKSFKDKYAGSEGPKKLEKISLGDNENLYRTAEGQLWYVSKQPDGKTVKMQVQFDDATGEMILVDVKSGGSQNLQKISLSDYEDLYITEEGQQWYVSDNPDGSSSKSRVEIDDTTGEVTILENYSDDGQGSAEKD